jgi:hypothetical protein
MGMIIWHIIGDEEAPEEDGLALDLQSCVYDGTKTKVYAVASAGNACDFNSATGLEAWCQVNGTIFQGVDFVTPYEAPGGTISDNLNSAAITISSAKFSQNGTYLFTGGTAEIRTLSTPYLLSSATLTSSNAVLDKSVETISWDGLAVYTFGAPSNTLKVWTLPDAWDLDSPVAGTTIMLPNSLDGICVSRDQTRIYGVNSGLQVVQEYIMATPGDPSSIPADGFGIAIPNYELDVTIYMDNVVDLAVSYDQEHLLISGASSVPPDGGFMVTFTGNAV